MLSFQSFLFLMIRPPPRTKRTTTLFTNTTLFRSCIGPPPRIVLHRLRRTRAVEEARASRRAADLYGQAPRAVDAGDRHAIAFANQHYERAERKSTRLNSSH